MNEGELLANVSLGIRNPSLDLKPQSIIINGGFGQ